MRNQHSSPRNIHRRPNRRGMSLLFVLSLILFITLLATSFVVVSTQFSRSSKIRTRLDARGDSSRQLVERAFYDLVRGPDLNNANSPLRGLDILSDMYGYGFRATISNAVPSTSFSGAVDFSIPVLNSLGPDDGSTNWPNVPLVETVDAYNGQVLTFVSGPLYGTSTRVVDYTFDAVNGGVFTILINPAAITEMLGQAVVLNGKPFSGWGAGGLGLGGGGLANAALLPRRMNDSPVYNNATPNGDLADYIRTGVNESYDAFGFQNPFLAYDPDGNPVNFRASFNDPELFNSLNGQEKKYANFRPVTNLYVDAQDPARQVDRASGWANPTEPPDVDNDGDGQLDSIWMDFGYPVQTDLDGRRYKPLVAVMIQDMDGRLNVNAHGNGFQLDRAVNPNNFLLGRIDPSQQELPRGAAMGPAEVDLRYLLNDNAVFAQLLATKYRTNPDDPALPGIPLFQSKDFRDPWNFYQQIGYPDTNAGQFYGVSGFPDSYTNPFVSGSFGTALDLHGRFVTGIPDPLGGIPTLYPQRASTSQLIADPGEEVSSSAYEFSISRNSRIGFGSFISDDQPYTPMELESVLRRFDRDATGLSRRLVDLFPNPENIRQQITTESWEVPAVPSFAHPTTGNPISITEYMFLLLRQNMTADEANSQLQNMLALDLRMGLPFDINRPFGDGKDNNGNGVYDEHAQSTDPAVNEASDAEYLRIPLNFGGDGTPVPTATQLIDPNFDGDNNPNTRQLNHLARWQYAKELYVLALLATGDTGQLGGANSLTARRRTAVAQWVVNVVDYRDSDSINTPFEFDLHPFDGWSVDGFLGVGPGPDGVLGNGDDVDDSTVGNTQLELVWGVERPELLISETLATHDRRTQDLDSIGGGEFDDGNGDDDDFDSKLVPRASAFFELHHPWSQDNNNQLIPAELSASNQIGVDLKKLNVNGDPVWRMVVVKNAGMNQNPQTTDIDEAEVVRRIYFNTPSGDLTKTDTVGSSTAFSGLKTYFPSVSGDLLIQRGGYAVIGSSGVGTEAAYGETFFGRRNDTWETELPETRRIILDDSSDSVSVYDPVTANISTRNEVGVVIIDQCNAPGTPTTRSLGISDPVNGYPGAKTEIEDGFEFDTGLDAPVDNDTTIQPDSRVLFNGTTESFAEVHLQRLANPLLAYDPDLNPYLSIDTKTVDLVSFNGAEDDSGAPGINDVDTLFASGERGRMGDPLYDGPLAGNRLQRRMLWMHEESGTPVSSVAAKPEFTDLAGADDHVFSFELHESIGTLNEAYTDVAPRPSSDLTSGDFAPVGFGGFPWLNRPFASRMEMLDVTYLDSHQLLFNYTIPDFTPGTFQHLLPMQTEFDTNSSVPLGMFALFDFVRVPTPFTGCRDFFANMAPPFNVLSHYREPGKLNLNTMRLAVNQEPSWTGLLGPMYGAVGTAEGQFVSGNSTTYTAGQANFNAIRSSMTSNVAGNPALIDNPFRNSIEFDKMPLGATVPAAPFDHSLFRTETKQAVFAASGSLPYADPTRDSAAANGILRKLGATTTTRSSVFAIWITVGKFEVDANDNLLGTSAGLVELGADEGKNQRSRGFYLIDRSIPVGFEPGVNHNVENIILAETIMD